MFLVSSYRTLSQTLRIFPNFPSAAYTIFTVISNYVTIISKVDEICLNEPADKFDMTVSII